MLIILSYLDYQTFEAGFYPSSKANIIDAIYVDYWSLKKGRSKLYKSVGQHGQSVIDYKKKHPQPLLFFFFWVAKVRALHFGIGFQDLACWQPDTIMKTLLAKKLWVNAINKNGVFTDFWMHFLCYWEIWQMVSWATCQQGFGEVNNFAKPMFFQSPNKMMGAKKDAAH